MDTLSKKCPPPPPPHLYVEFVLIHWDIKKISEGLQLKNNMSVG